METNDGQLEPLALYDERVYAAGEGYPGYRVNVLKTGGTCPARFDKHIGKTVESNGVMWEVFFFSITKRLARVLRALT